MSNIRELKTNAPDPELIERLEFLLQEAKEGKARCMIYAVGYIEGASANGYIVDTVSDVIKLIGEITVLQVRMSNRLKLEQSD